MDWTDDGIILSARRHGETSVIATMLTREHGRHAGIVRGGAGRRQRGVLQAGTLVRATWRARLTEHLGNFTCEPISSAPAVLADPLRLSALSAACAVADAALPERQACPAALEGLRILVQALAGEAWPTVFVKWEIGLLGELGYGLDLSRCAATGRNDELAYVSPKTGRAVSLSAGKPYRNLLLRLPGFLLKGDVLATPTEVADGLALTGHFLARHVFAASGGLPPARVRLFDRLHAAAEAG
jgi:DNA repair protein RecO (recombination protein O)